MSSILSMMNGGKSSYTDRFGDDTDEGSPSGSDDGSDSDDDLFAKASKNKKSKKNKKRLSKREIRARLDEAVDLSDDDDDDAVLKVAGSNHAKGESYTLPSTSTNRSSADATSNGIDVINILDDDDDDDHDSVGENNGGDSTTPSRIRQVREELIQDIKQNAASSSQDAMDVIDVDQDSGTEDVQKDGTEEDDDDDANGKKKDAQQMLQYIKDRREAALKHSAAMEKKEAKKTAAANRKAAKAAGGKGRGSATKGFKKKGASKVWSSILDDNVLDGLDDAPMERIKTAAERQREAEMKNSMFEKRLQSMEEVEVKINDPSSFSSSSSSSSSSKAAALVDASENLLKVGLRVNNKFKCFVPIDPSKNFGVAREKFAYYFDLHIADIKKLTFDGDALKDAETAEYVEMEEEDLIDMAIDDGVYDDAVAYYEKAQSNNSPGRNTGQDTFVKLKTELNGQHEWKWKISIVDPFLNMKNKFAEIYGLALSDIKAFAFKRELLSHKDTPSSIQPCLKDGDIVTVEIDASKFEAAVESATARNTNKYSSKTSGNIFAIDDNEEDEDEIKVSISVQVHASISKSTQDTSYTLEMATDKSIQSMHDKLETMDAFTNRVSAHNMVYYVREGMRSSRDIIDTNKTLSAMSIFDGSEIVVRCKNLRVKCDMSAIKATMISAAQKKKCKNFELGLNPCISVRQFINKLNTSKKFDNAMDSYRIMFVDADGGNQVELVEGEMDINLAEAGFKDGSVFTFYPL